MKKTKSNIEGDRIIAEYLGFPVGKYSWWHHPDTNFTLGNRVIGSSLTNEMCRFSESFDWLIPVAKQIVDGGNPNKEVNVDVYGDVSIILGEYGNSIDRLSVRDGIETWYEAVVKFCKLYNSLYTNGKIKNVLPKK